METAHERRKALKYQVESAKQDLMLRSTLKQRAQARKLMFENVYDVIANTTFSDIALEQLRGWSRGKKVEYDADHGTIKIGRDFIITLLK